MLKVLLEVDVQLPVWKFDLGRCKIGGDARRKGRC